MADFTESMKAFTDRLKSSIDDRGESLARVHRATNDLLDGARDFLEDVAEEHHARAESVHAFMNDSRARRCETVGAMRDTHREALAAMSEEMHHALDEATRSRVEEVNASMAASHAHRCETSRAMREGHREELAAMSEGLRQALDEANRGRLEAVGMMRDTFRAARQELASDLRGAATAWREFAGRRDVEPTAEPKAGPATDGHGDGDGKKPKHAPAHRSGKRKASRAH